MTYLKNKLSEFYKKKIQNFFKYLYGEISEKILHTDNKDIIFLRTSIEKNDYNIYICKACSLYTDTIHDTAIIKNRKIVDGPSFQLRDNINVNCINNSVISKGTPRFRKKIKGKVLSLLTGGGGNANYWHWMFDVLPRLYIIKDKGFTFDYYLFPDLKHKFQKETLDLLQINTKKRLSSRSFRHFYADEIIVTSHPYTILNDPSIDSLKIPNWISEFLRFKFLKIGKKNSKLKNLPKKIFINRKDGRSLRYIINNNQVEDFLKKKGFKSLTMSDYSFADQVALFNNAKEIIGLHGAAFANLIFCKPKTKIIEMRPDTAGIVIKTLAVNNDLNYFDIISKPKTINFNNQQGDIEINIDTMKQIINS